jgi:hypothetical protein
MTDNVQLALIASIAPTIAAVGALLVSIHNANKAAAIEKKTDTVIEKAVEIHTLTNSNLSKVSSALEVANQKISGLEAMVGSLAASKQAADALASAKVAVEAKAPLPVPRVGS